MSNISISIVLHNTYKGELNEVISSCVNSSIPVDIFLIDNSPNDKLSCFKEDARVTYLKSDNNGFGAGHNLAINKHKLLEKNDYHLVMNPDIKFSSEIINNIADYMNNNQDIGVLMPRIVNRDGSIQYSRRLLPSPLDIVIKRFFPKASYNSSYEMTNMEPNDPVEIVALCGCFLFFRTEVLKSVGLFDDRYFMYFEDYDLCRRISEKYKTTYFPYGEVIHGDHGEHRKNKKLFFYAIRAALRYFNKWGYIDKSRNKINIKTLQQVKKSSKQIK
jgi:hypothetical protein|tara:strand:- start:257 stop:1078 length:822 start_codon:yes stop_codon:yes gene_type:complete